MPKSKAESHKEAIMSALEEDTESQAIAAAARAAKTISVERPVRAQELPALVEKALDGSGEPFRLTFDDDSALYLTTKEGILTATVTNKI